MPNPRFAQAAAVAAPEAGRLWPAQAVTLPGEQEAARVIRCPHWKVWYAGYGSPRTGRTHGGVEAPAVVALWLAAAGRDQLRVIDFATGIQLMEVELEAIPKTQEEIAADEDAEEGDAHGIMGVAVTDALTCAAAWGNGTVKIWKIPQGDEVMQLQTQDELTELALSRSGGTLVTSSNKYATIWDLQAGEMTFDVTDYDNINAICVTDNGATIGIGLSDGHVAVYSGQGKLKHKVAVEGLASVFALAVSATGDRIAASSSAGLICVCDAKGKVSLEDGREWGCGGEIAL
jgi:hypothetical protein